MFESFPEWPARMVGGADLYIRKNFVELFEFLDCFGVFHASAETVRVRRVKTDGMGIKLVPDTDDLRAVVLIKNFLKKLKSFLMVKGRMQIRYDENACDTLIVGLF